ncbi:hypothetical protein TUBRATIS_26480 [Tubulinosema ratisbonensis]|uniref:Uncharacterized protein n=1 Tax=Tubulinosema ratisbonensis TaxID=291195 RepID=A0A437AIM7_9MICR|nr:hypothetical protein TUBRATIS_26480 [Tubulinosema ratisbonensis]
MHDDTTKIVENEFDINTDNLLANNGVFDENFETNIFDEEILFGLCEEEIEEDSLEPQTERLSECTTELYQEQLDNQIIVDKNTCQFLDSNNSLNLVTPLLTNNSTTTNGIENPISVVFHENNTVDMSDFDKKIIQLIKKPQKIFIAQGEDIDSLNDYESCKFIWTIIIVKLKIPKYLFRIHLKM